MRLIALLFIFLLPIFSFAQDFSKRKSLDLTAEITSNQESIKLQWSDDLLASAYDVYRRVYKDSNWTFLETVKAPSLFFIDKTINQKTAYEYVVYKKTSTDIIGYGLVLAGINLDPLQSYGSVLLVVEDSLISALKDEINRLKEDLSNDGWLPLIETVNAQTEVKKVKEIITEAYKKEKSLSTVILIGDVQVPYSGLIAPDGHFADHLGAWPCDGFYGDIDGNWTDKTVNSTKATRNENRNLPFDGKFDQSEFPSEIELIIGRIYLENMNANAGFSSNRFDLYKNYLDKNHSFRTGEYQPQPKALILNGLANLEEGFSAIGYRYFDQIVEADSLIEASSFDELSNGEYLISYACGLGSYTGLNNIVASADFAKKEYNSVFLGLLGSYFGDWDTENNFLRAPLAGKNPSLVSFWSGRPNWELHEFAAGLPIGQSLLNCQNNEAALSEWPNSLYNGSIHISLMGDPTLKAKYSKPVSNLMLSSPNKTEVNLSWTAREPNAVYYVYRKNEDGNYNQLNKNPIKGENYLDSFPNNGINLYMVKSAYLNAHGFSNLSKGVFAQIEGIEREAVSYSKPSLASQNLQIFPNPSSQFISINTAIPIGTATFEIRNADGKVVLQSNFEFAKTFPYQIDLSKLPKGLYILKISRENEEPLVGRFYKI